MFDHKSQGKGKKNSNLSLKKIGRNNIHETLMELTTENIIVIL
jgi:hypothetical protein